MKDVINYYYNLVVDKIYKSKNKYFFYNDEKYYILECNDSSKLKHISNFIKNVNNNLIISELINTKDGKYSFLYKNIEYVIIKIPLMEKLDINLNDIIKYNIDFKFNYDFIKTDEYTYMTDIVDYYEEKLLGYVNEFSLIQKYFDYYVGLAENSISYLKDSLYNNNDEILYALSHKKIRFLKLGELIDITNITYNYRMKDISEYIKCKIIKKQKWIDEVSNFLDYNKLNFFDYKFLYCSVLFPDYFFDLIDEVIDGNIKEEDVKELIENVNYYEKEINKLYNLIEKYCKIPKIDWIK